MKSRTLFLAAPLFIVVGAYGADVTANWSEHCAKCHGEDGKGQTKMGRKLSIADLSDSKVQARFTDGDAMKAIKEGVKDNEGKVTMKPIENLKTDEMYALVTYVRGLRPTADKRDP